MRADPWPRITSWRIDFTSPGLRKLDWVRRVTSGLPYKYVRLTPLKHYSTSIWNHGKGSQILRMLHSSSTWYSKDAIQRSRTSRSCFSLWGEKSDHQLRRRLESTFFKTHKKQTRRSFVVSLSMWFCVGYIMRETNEELLGKERCQSKKMEIQWPGRPCQWVFHQLFSQTY